LRDYDEFSIPAIHGVVRWRLIDLSQWIYEEFRITVAKQTLSRELRPMGYRKLSARPRHHAQAEGAIENFQKNFQRAWMKSRAKSDRRRQNWIRIAAGKLRNWNIRADRDSNPNWPASAW
jgi:hypothetical protein